MDALEEAQVKLNEAIHKSKVAYEAQMEAKAKCQENVLKER